MYTKIFRAPLPVVNNMMFMALSSTSVSLHWIRAQVTPDCTAMYTIQVNLTDTDTIFLTKETDKFAVNISSLMMNTNYSYRVAGVDNADRIGKWSAKSAFS